MKFQFSKYHALGNDYIVIDPNKVAIHLSPQNIQLICHRHFGIGSDGILYGPLSEKNILGLKIYNPDGSEAEKSGNGIRIFSRFLLDEGYVTHRKFNLQTLGGMVQVEILDKQGRQIQVDMGKVTFQSQQIPISGPAREVLNEPLTINNQPLAVTCLSIGNPHCVLFCDNLSAHLATELGPAIENHAVFPNRINVQFVKVLDRKNIQIEIWERGAGYTLASGSSSCAAAIAAHRLGFVGEDITVHMPGGTIQVNIQSDQHVFMTGAVTAVSKGVFSEDLWQQLLKK